MDNSLIVNTLKPLGIDIAFMQYQGTADKYVVFQVYKDQDAFFSDDESEAVTNYVEIGYWYENPADKSIADEIKVLMKQAGFMYDGGQDMFNEGFYGRKMDFIFTEFVEVN